VPVYFDWFGPVSETFRAADKLYEIDAIRRRVRSDVCFPEGISTRAARRHNEIGFAVKFRRFDGETSSNPKTRL